MIVGTALVLFYFLTPFFILYLCHKFPFVNKLGAVLIAYLAGIILGVFNIVPPEYKQLQETIMTITVPLALPLMLLFSFMGHPRSFSVLFEIILLVHHPCARVLT